MVGIDTGFFITLMRGNRQAVETWTSFSANDEKLIVSVLTLGEILYFSYRVGKPENGQEMTRGIVMASDVIDVNQAIVEKASALKTGRNIPYVDSIIIATFLENACTEIHTTDRKHFNKIKNNNVQFKFWDILNV